MAKCPRCGASVADSSRFCGECGAPVRPRQELRKTVTILFSDVVDSTLMGEQSDPETVRHAMSRYSNEMSRIVERHGGAVEHFRGDEVMAVFGVPTAHEDDALRAVRAGMAMQQRLVVLNEELRATWGVTLDCRIGINTGEVVAGDPGTGATFVTGDAVNLAKRLEQAAAAGEVLIGAATYPLVRDAASEIRLNITRARARGLINRLVHEPNFRERFEADTLAVLSEHGIEVSAESLPYRVRLPEPAAIEAFLSLLETRIAAEPASPFGAAVLVLAFGAMPVVVGSRPVLDGTG